MKENISNKEFFTEIREKTYETKKYDYFSIIDDKTGAIIYDSDLSHICNAIVIVKSKGGIKEWHVDNYKVTQCPEPLEVCIKNVKVIARHIGDEEKEESYFKLKKGKGIQPHDLSIFAAVETEESAIAFYYDGINLESRYIWQTSYGNLGEDLFMIVKYLRDLGVMIYENTRIQEKGLEG